MARDTNKVLWINDKELLTSSDEEGFILKAHNQDRIEDEYTEKPEVQTDNGPGIKKSYSEFFRKKFTFENLDNLIHENVVTVEDDR